MSKYAVGMDTSSVLSGGDKSALLRGGSRLTARERQEKALQEKKNIILQKGLEVGDIVSFGDSKREFPISNISSRGDIYLEKHRLGFHPREIVLKSKAQKKVPEKIERKAKKKG